MAKNDFSLAGVLEADIEPAKAAIQKWVSDVRNQTRELSDEIQGYFRKEIVQTLALEVKTDSSGVRQVEVVSKELGRISDQLNTQVRQLTKTQVGSVTNLRQSLNTAKQTRDEIVKYGESVDGLGRKVRTLNPAWEAANAQVVSLARQLDVASASGFWQKIKAELNLGGFVNAGRTLNGLVNTFQSLSIVIGQVQAPVRALLNSLNDLQQIELLFKGIGQGPAGVSKVFADSSAIALKYGVNLKTVRDSFAQLTPVVTASGGSLDDVSSIISALSSRFVTFGLSAEKSRRVMNGIIQAFGKGKLMAEELTQQISEADPAFKTDLANAIGVSVKQLGEMVKAGEITSDKLLEFIPQLAKTSNFFGNLGTSATSAFQALARGNATVEQVQNQFATLTQLNLEAFTGKDLFRGLIGSFLQIGAAIVDLITNIRKLEALQTLANIINNVALQLSGLFTITTQVISVILKFTEPIFAAINAIDKFAQSLIGIRPIVGLIGAAITATLIKSLLALAAPAIPTVIAALTGLRAALLATATAGFAGSAKAVLAYVTNLLKVPPAAAAAAAAGRGAAGAAAAGSVADTAASYYALKAGQEAAAKGAQTLNVAQKTQLARFGQVAAVLGIAAFAFDGYRKDTEIAREASGQFSRTLDDLDSKYKQVKVGTTGAGAELSKFQKELRAAFVEGKKRNVFEITVDFITNADAKSILSGQAIERNLGGQFKRLQAQVADTKKELAAYNAEQDRSGDKAEALGQKVKLRVDGYDALIQKLQEARDKQLALAKESGGGISKGFLGFNNEFAQLEKLDQGIQKVKKQRDEFIKGAQAQGIALDLKFTSTGAPQVATTLGGIKNQVKELEEKSVAIPLGTKEYEQTISKLNGLKSLADFIERDPIKIAIQFEFEQQLAAFRNGLEVASALVDNTNARVGLEQSIFDIYKGRASYATTQAESELQALRDRGASTDAIAAKESEIAGLKATERNLEKDALINKLTTLGSVQAAESNALAIKQQIAKIEADMAVNSATRAANEAKIAESAATAAFVKAQKDGSAADKENALAILNLARENSRITGEQVTLAQQRVDAVASIAALERDTLAINQQIARNQLEAQGAALGIADSYAKTNQQLTGTIEAGGQIKQVFATIPTTVNDTIEKLREAGQGAIPLSTESKKISDNARSAAYSFSSLSDKAGLAARGISDIQIGPQTEFENSLKNAKTSVDGIVQSGLGTAIQAGADQGAALSEGLIPAAQEAQTIVDKFNELDGKTINVNVNVTGTPGLWTGGPTEAGNVYRVNELGREAFLSAGGNLSMINKPRNALWRAPSSGMVIPAHIASMLTIPGTGIKASAGITSRLSSGISGGQSSGSGMASAIAKAMQSTGAGPEIQQLAAVQATQAMQIGNLSRAVSDLASKDWNVNVKVKNTGSGAFLEALNRRM